MRKTFLGVIVVGLLFDIVISGHDRKESDSDSKEIKPYPRAKTSFNLTEICNCSDIDFNVTTTYEPENESSSKKDNNKPPKKSKKSSSSSKKESKKDGNKDSKKNGKKSASKDSSKNSKKGGKHRRLGSNKKPSKDSNKHSSKDSSKGGKRKPNKRKPKKKANLVELCSDYCNTTDITTTLIETTTAMDTTTVMDTTTAIDTTTVMNTTVIIECPGSEQVCEGEGDPTCPEFEACFEIPFNSTNFKCCLEGEPESQRIDLLKNMSLGEKLQYYYNNNTAIFMIIITGLVFVIIGLIIGFTLYIKKLKNEYKKPNSDDIIKPNFIKHTNHHERVSTVEIDN